MIALFTTTIFLSAFLLFWIQPLYAKMALPLLGGAPAVWNTAMVFYQAALLLGYAYAHISVRRLGLRRQIALHLALLVVPAAALPVAISRFGTPAGAEDPVGWMLRAMVVTVGMPYLAVSATSPLVQRWFAASGHAASSDPYFLYAASNAGSMAALVAFPLALEPRLSIETQSAIWGWGYIVFVALLTVCGLLVRKRLPPSESAPISGAEPREPLSWARRLRWAFLAAVPCSLMLGLTAFASTDIAVVPMFWVVPLALYLLSFLFVFAKRPPFPHGLWLRALPWMLAALVFTLAVPLEKPVWVLLGANLATFFVAAMACHGELARDRPSVGRLTDYFLTLSLGGALGGAFNALFAPVAFVAPIEYSIALLAAALALPQGDRGVGWMPLVKDVVTPFAVGAALASALVLERRFGMTSSSQSTLLLLGAGALCCLLWVPRPIRFGLSLAALLLVGKWQDQDPRRILFAGRSFFGVHRVVELPASQVRSLQHGKVMHGSQSFRDGLEGEPQSYYGRKGPFGTLIAALDLSPEARVGVIGLGVGSVAAYAEPGQYWTFFEIDPVVVRIARDPNLFTYLANVRGKVDVVLGDGRLTLARANGKFDLLVLDAFSSDAIPAHLLTREAFELYRTKLKPGGAIAVNITNKHLDLEPLIAAQARACGMSSWICRDWRIEPEDRRNGRAASTWSALFKSPSTAAKLDGLGLWEPARSDDRLALWTDDHSSVLSVLTRL